jgi:hypothetical protein
MKFSRTIARLVSWIGLFSEALVGQDVAEGTIGVQVPGLLRENGKPNNKGNVIVAVNTNDVADLMAELRTAPRELTPAEMVRRTLEVSEGVVSFKTSADSGSRTVKVPQADWAQFLDSLEDKFEDATDMLLEAERLTAEANTGTEDADAATAAE